MAKGKVKTKQATATIEKPKSSVSKKKDGIFLLGRNNYILMFAGIALILIGFALMAGGKTTDQSVFPAEEIYSFQRIVLAPILVMIGFVIEVFAIMMKPKSA